MKAMNRLQSFSSTSTSMSSGYAVAGEGAKRKEGQHRKGGAAGDESDDEGWHTAEEGEEHLKSGGIGHGHGMQQSQVSSQMGGKSSQAEMRGLNEKVASVQI